MAIGWRAQQLAATAGAAGGGRERSTFQTFAVAVFACGMETTAPPFLVFLVFSCFCLPPWY